MKERFESAKAGVLGPHYPKLALAAVPCSLMLAFAATAVLSGHYAILASLVHLAVLGTFGLAWALRPTGRRPKTGGLTVTEEGLFQGGELVERRADLLQGFVVPQPDRTLVRFQRRGVPRSIWVQVADAVEGHSLLQALGFDARQKAAELRAASIYFTFSLFKQLAWILAPTFLGIVPLALLTALFLPKVVAGPLMVSAALGFVGFVFTSIFWPTTVRIGADGLFTEWLGRKRFIPHARVAKAESYAHRIGGKVYVGVLLSLDDGTTVRIPTGQARWSDTATAELLTRVEEALAVHRAGGGTPEASALARGDRAPSDWVVALRRVGAGANADMRTATVSVEQLLRIVEDATASAIRRASAAVAAAGNAGEDGQRRIRIAAETSAQPRLRIALERAAQGDDDPALAEALAELEADAGAGATRTHRA